MIQQHDSITTHVRDEASFGMVDRAGDTYGWKEFAIDCGYSLDAPAQIPAGSLVRIDPSIYTELAPFSFPSRTYRDFS